VFNPGIIPTDNKTLKGKNYLYGSVNQGIATIAPPAIKKPRTVGTFLPTVSKIIPRKRSKPITNN